MIKNRGSYYTTIEAANILGFTPDHVRRLIQRGKIKAEKLGTCWIIKKTDLTIKRQRFPRDKDAQNAGSE